MALFSFSKFKPCNSPFVHRAVLKGLEASEGAYIGAAYVFYDNQLIIAFTPSVRPVASGALYRDAEETTRFELPKEFSNVAFWDDKRFSNECPEKVKKATGYVSAFHPESRKG